MKKLEMNIGEVLSLQSALIKLMNIRGIPFKKSYLLKRNLDKISPIAKKWYETKVKSIFDKYAISIPVKLFIPIQKQEAFKKELFVSLEKLLNPEIKVIELSEIYQEVKSIFDKYEDEMPNEQSCGIPLEKASEYRKELEDLSKREIIEFELFDIELDSRLEEVLSQLELEAQISIQTLIVEESTIKIAQTILQ